MKKWQKAIALTSAFVLVMTGCGKKTDTNATTQPTADGQKQTTQAAQTEARSDAKTPEAESAGGDGAVLTVYSPQADADRGPWISDRVKKDLGIDVEFLTATGGELSERLRAEKQNPQADIILGLVQTAMYQLKNEELLMPYTPSWAEGLPEVYKEKEGYFHSFWQTPIVISYNSDFISESDAPKSWLDLTDPKYKEMYNIGNTSSQTVRTFIIGMLWQYYDAASGDISEDGWNFLRDFFLNARTLPTGSDSWALMKDGTLPLVLSWFGGIQSKCELNEIPVAYVNPDGGTPIVAEAVGIIKGTKNEELAKKFVDWWGSAEVMSDYAAEFGQAPAHPAAIALCPDEVKKDAEMFTAQDIDWEVAAAKLDEWFEKIELEIMP